jgi:hypothetical protein
MSTNPATTRQEEWLMFLYRSATHASTRTTGANSWADRFVYFLGGTIAGLVFLAMLVASSVVFAFLAIPAALAGALWVARHRAYPVARPVPGRGDNGHTLEGVFHAEDR